MNSGQTTVRVYAVLKTRIMSGDFLCGERLDPVALASELASSATPIRDALHWLTGERLVENGDHAGFRIPLTTETDLRDLFRWNAELMDSVTRIAARVSKAGFLIRSVFTHKSELDVAYIFHTIALATGNNELCITVVNMNDRLALFRKAEMPFIKDGTAPSDIIYAIESGRWPEVRSLIRAYHKECVRIVPDLVRATRFRDADNR
jgi:hypothetical protein